MGDKKVEIILGKDDSIKSEAFGFKGGSCEEATIFLNRLFGKPVHKKLKPSHHETDNVIVDGLPSGYCG